MTEHPGPLLSALADGHLDPSERAAVEAHLARCEPCRRELDACSRLRDAVAALPPVDPPGWFLPAVLADGPQPHRRRVQRVRFGIANVAATAAAWLVFVGVTSQPAVPAASPDLAGMVAAHRQVSAERLASGPGASIEAPARIGSSYELAGYRSVAGTTQAVYTDGERWLSLFAEPGRLDPSILPAGAEALPVAGDRAWSLDSSGGELVIVDQGDAVVVLVADAGSAPAPLPDGVGVATGGAGTLDRLAEAAAGLLRSFSLAG